jgi:DNA-binding NarL/FixJ family response regulator
MTQRVLAAADSYQSSLEQRPHRPALSPAEAAGRLRAEARSGRLDAAAVDAVLEVSGHRSGPRSLGPAGLTSREVEVLALAARGASTEEVARRLSISTKTVRNHLEHIYAKAQVSNRTGAALFAVEHGLVNGAEDEAPAP